MVLNVYPFVIYVQCIGNVHGRLSPYRDAQEDSFYAMHEAVIYSLDEMDPFLRR